MKNNIAADDNNIYREAVMNNRDVIVGILLSFLEVAAYETKYQFKKKWLMLNK